MLFFSTSVSLSMCTPQVRVPASPGSLDAAMTALHSVQQASALQQSRLRKLPPGTFPVPADGAMPWLDLEDGYGAFLVVEADSPTGNALADLLYDVVEAAVTEPRG